MMSYILTNWPIITIIRPCPFFGAIIQCDIWVCLNYDVLGKRKKLLIPLLAIFYIHMFYSMQASGQSSGPVVVST